ncbi:inactive N-acetylated-alpha-linked acidic dipeptidase-like protein 2 [Rhinophrynus dorsalis]
MTETARTSKCLPLEVLETGKEKHKIILNIQSVPTYKNISNSYGFLRGSVLPGKYVILGSPHASHYGESMQEWVSGAAIMASIIESIMIKVKEGWRPNRTIIFCSFGGTPFGNIGSYKWGEEFKRVLESNAVAYISLQKPVRGNISLHSFSSPSLHQLSTEVIKKIQINCTTKEICYSSNVSNVQIEGDADFFTNHLGIPAAQFVFNNLKTSEDTNFLSEAVFTAREKTNQQTDSFFHLHEYIAKLTSEVVLQIASEPVLPFNALDTALEIQKNLEGDDTSSSLMEKVRNLREIAQLFQSNEMRPANDPKERDPVRVRMLNDVLQNLEKNFLVQTTLPGFSRNILYRLDGRTTRFSILQEAQEQYKIYKSNETLLAALQEVFNCITSAQLYFKESLHVFETEKTEI